MTMVHRLQIVYHSLVYRYSLFGKKDKKGDDRELVKKLANNRHKSIHCHTNMPDRNVGMVNNDFFHSSLGLDRLLICYLQTNLNEKQNKSFSFGKLLLYLPKQ